MLESIMSNTTVFFLYSMPCRQRSYTDICPLSSPDLCHQSREIPPLLIPVNGTQVEQFQADTVPSLPGT